MAFQLSPGVNVTEKDLTTIVPAVATTNAAFAGPFAWGPIDKVVIVDSENSLVSNFGLPNDINFDSWFSAANFLQYGNNLRVVRSVKATASAAKNAVGAGKTPELVRNEDHVGSVSAATHGAFIARYAGSIGNSIGVSVCGSSAGADGFDGWEFKNEFDKAPSTSSYVESLGGTADEFHIVVYDDNGLWTGATGSVLERYSFVSLSKNAQDSQGNSIYYGDKINNSSKYIMAAINATASAITNGADSLTGLVGFNYRGDNLPSSISFKTAYYSLTGGADEARYTNEADIISIVGSGLSAFTDADTQDVNLIIGGPEYVAASETTVNVGVGTTIKNIVESRKDCIGFVSAPVKDPTKTENDKLTIAKNYRDTIGSSSYMFIDSGYKYMYDIYNDKYRYVPLNGDIAGLCARSDSSTDPWFSPAGFNRGNIKNVVKLAFNPSLTFRDELYKNGINPVVTFPGEGTVLYGDKTAQAKPSAFDRINVRRLFIVLEKAIATAAKYSLFEFNDSFTRAQFRSLVEPFLRDVQARRGIVDYKVVCDEKNNTAEVIDGNRFVADIYIKPARSINFIQLNFVATRTGVSFSEVGA